MIPHTQPTEEREAIVVYLSQFAGRRLSPLKVLNAVARYTSRSNTEARTRTEAVAAAFLKLRPALDQLVRERVVIKRSRLGEEKTIRINEAFVRK